jgi:hypothetical protein
MIPAKNQLNRIDNRAIVLLIGGRVQRSRRQNGKQKIRDSTHELPL